MSKMLAIISSVINGRVLLKIESAINSGGVWRIKLNLQEMRVSLNVPFNFYVLSDTALSGYCTSLFHTDLWGIVSVSLTYPMFFIIRTFPSEFVTCTALK